MPGVRAGALMSKRELVFERGKAVQLSVSESDGGSFYVVLHHFARRSGRTRVMHLASATGVLAREMALVKVEGYDDWTLEAEGARFTLSEREAHRVAEQFPRIAQRLIPRLETGT